MAQPKGHFNLWLLLPWLLHFLFDGCLIPKGCHGGRERIFPRPNIANGHNAGITHGRIQNETSGRSRLLMNRDILQHVIGRTPNLDDGMQGTLGVFGLDCDSHARGRDGKGAQGQAAGDPRR